MCELAQVHEREKVRSWSGLEGRMQARMQTKSRLCRTVMLLLAQTLVSDTSGELSNPGHCLHLPLVEGGILKKDFHYQSSVHPLWLPDRSRHSFMRQLPVKFRSFSATFIMDGHLLRSVALTFRKPNAAQCHRNKAVTLTAKWGGSFMNFWKGKQAETFQAAHNHRMSDNEGGWGGRWRQCQNRPQKQTGR